MNTQHMMLIKFPGSQKWNEVITKHSEKELLEAGNRLLLENIISSYQIMSTVGKEITLGDVQDAGNNQEVSCLL